MLTLEQRILFTYKEPLKKGGSSVSEPFCCILNGLVFEAFSGLCCNNSFKGFPIYCLSAERQSAALLGCGEFSFAASHFVLTFVPLNLKLFLCYIFIRISNALPHELHAEILFGSSDRWTASISML